MQVRKTIIWILIGIALLVAVIRFGYQPLSKFLGFAPRSGLRVEANIPAKVSINGKEVGNTPYEDQNLIAGEYEVEIKGTITDASSQNKSTEVSWKRQVKLYKGTLTVVHRELSTDPNSSSGEVITLEKGKGVSIISNPSEAEVSVDGQTKESTPFHTDSISTGEHQFIISKDNYLKRSVRATAVDGFTLTINVDLAMTDDNPARQVTASSSPAPTVSPSTTPTPSPSSSTSTYQVTVVNTPNGFLRVRKSASTSAAEVTRVNDGDTLTVLQDAGGGWLKVQLANGTVGFVSSVYTKKK